MRSASLFVALVLVALAGVTAWAAAPDPEFSRQADAEISAKHAEFLQEIERRGAYATDQQDHQAWCRAIMWWKMAHPDGEERLTLESLTKLRRMEVYCGHRMRRPAPLDWEQQTPPPLHVTVGPLGVEDHQGDHEAQEDYARWHPEEFEEAESEDEYVSKQLYLWELLGEGKDLLKAISDAQAAALPTGTVNGQSEQSRYNAVDVAQGRYEAARAAAAEEARRRWRESHPGEVGAEGPFAQNEAWRRPSDGGDDGGPPPGHVRDPYRGGYVPAPPPGHVRDPYRGGYYPDPDAGSIDPLDPRWRGPREPVEVGPNDEVGSGARRRSQAIGVLAGAIGVGGGRRSNGPDLMRCRVDDMAQFRSGDVTLGVAAQRDGDEIVVFVDIVHSPDNGTFQAIALQDQFGRMLQPIDIGICDLYGEWRLSVSWSQSTYQGGRQTSQSSGGWGAAGDFGLGGGSAAEGGLWRQLGFSSASHGAKRIAVRYRVAPGQLSADGGVLLLHVTRPSQDPVTTQPFALLLDEFTTGFEFVRCP